jgi:hypothetical protein
MLPIHQLLGSRHGSLLVLVANCKPRTDFAQSLHQSASRWLCLVASCLLVPGHHPDDLDVEHYQLLNTISACQ